MSTFPLSPIQRRLAAQGRIDTRTTVIFETPEAKPLDHWRARFDDAVARHEILRTTLEVPAGLKEPVQVIGERSDATLSVDGRTLTIELASAVTDPRSLCLLARELHDPSSAEAEPMQYADAGQWLDEVLEEDEGAEARAFWAERAANPAPPLYPPASEPMANELRHPLPALAEAADPEAAFVAAWASLARRLHGEAVPAFAVRVDGRFHEDLDGGLGPFARLAPARLSIDGSDTFETLLGRAAEELGELRDLQPQLDPPAEAADPAVVLAFEDWRDLPAGWELRELHDGGSAATLTLVAAREADGFALRVRHPPSLPTTRATHVAEQLASVLSAGLKDPSTEALALPAVPDSHRALLLEEWSPPVSPPEPARLDARFAAAAVEHSEATAVIAGDASLTYRELAARARQIAEALEDAEIEPGERVAISVERSPDLLAALLGCAMRGATYVPLDPAYPAERIALLLSDSSAAHAIVDRPDPRFEAATVLADLPAPILSDEPPPVSRASVDDVAYVIYTSGSTGRPKGVEVTHRQLHASNDARHRHYGGGPGTFLLLSSIAFDSSVAGIVWTLTSGGTLVLPAEGEERDPDALAERVRTHEVTTLLTLPSLYRLLLERSERLASLRCAIVAGEACPRALVLAHQGALSECALHNEYGPTEGTVWSTVWRATEPPPERIPIGGPIAHARAYVVDERDALAPIGAAGELWIGGAGVAKGYLHDTERTVARFGDDPFGEGRIYRTGDRVRWGEGELEFLGRLDDQVKVRGFRVELGEVEAALADLEGVREAAVTVRGEGGAARLVGYLIHPGELDTERLRAALSERLPAYMVPTLVRIDALPRTPNGKIDRDALPAPESLGRATSTPFVAPRDPVEEVMAGLWQQLLAAEQVGVHDDFFELGGTSLLVTQVVARVRHAFRIEVPLRMLFDHPTVESFVGALRADASRAATMERLAPLLLELARKSLDEASDVVARHGSAE